MRVEKNKAAAPVLKWAGGKRQLLNQLNKYIPEKYNTYYEPFVGGGALLFHLQPERAVINDINEELINLYNVIKNDIDGLISCLKEYINDEEYYYEIREMDRRRDSYSKLSDVKKASRIIFLNKTCYNGLFRVNSSGEFNTPFGRYKNPKILDEITLRAVSDYFNSCHVRILSCDFAHVLKDAKDQDFVYFDPPYDPLSNSSSFTGYDKGGFNRDEQYRLKLVCDELSSRGVQFMLSNSDTEFIRELYSEYNIETVQAKRVINSMPNKRGQVNEVLVRNYERKRSR